MNTQHKLLSSCPVSCFADEIAESLDRQIEVLSRLAFPTSSCAARTA